MKETERTGKTERIKQLLSQLTTEAGANLSENSLSDVPLDDLDVAEALLIARDKKAQKMREAEYWEEVNKTPTPVEMSPQTLKEYVLRAFAEAFHKQFVIDESNSEIFNILLWYFSSSQHLFEGNIEGLSRKKGIALYGAVGCGKTAMMKMFRSNPFQSYSVRGCSEISNLVEQQGSQEAEYFMDKIGTSRNIFRHFNLGICFDDLGLEPNETVYYGNRKRIMEEIIWTRYHKDLPFNMTHITTNLNAEDIHSRYGERIASRMNEMFNFISFPDNSPDRRK